MSLQWNQTKNFQVEVPNSNPTQRTDFVRPKQRACGIMIFRAVLERGSIHGCYQRIGINQDSNGSVFLGECGKPKRGHVLCLAM